MPNLVVNAVAQWNGKALKKGSKDISSFEKSIGKLGKTLAGAFGVYQIAAFGKASLKAFTEDQASAVKLAKAVDNLGLSFSNPDITNFIRTLESQSGIVDEKLRPAFQGLLTTTGDVAKAQQLLTSAIDISRGSGEDLATVSQDLSNGYVGITRGLKKYNLGLTQSQLKSKSFEEILALLNKQFSGSSAAYLDTYAGKIDKLTTAADVAKETIGKGLVDALSNLTGESGSINTFTADIQTAADATANFERGIGKLINKIITLGGIIPSDMKFSDTLGAKLLGMSPAALIAKLGKPKIQAPSGYGNSTGTMADFQYNQKEIQTRNAKLKADAKALEILKQLNKAKASTAAADKQSAMTAKQSLLFNQTAISAVAALKGKLSDEERNKVELMLALEMDNTTEAARLSQLVAKAYDSTGQLAMFLKTLPEAKNPFASWQAYLDSILAQVTAIVNASKTPTYTPATINPALAAIGVIPGYGDYSGSTSNQSPNTEYPNYGMQSNGGDITTNLPDQPLISYDPNTGLNYNANANNGITQNFSVTVNNPIGNGIVDMVQQAVLDAGRLGHNLVPAGSL